MPRRACMPRVRVGNAVRCVARCVASPPSTRVMRVHHARATRPQPDMPTAVNVANASRFAVDGDSAYATSLGWRRIRATSRHAFTLITLIGRDQMTFVTRYVGAMCHFPRSAGAARTYASRRVFPAFFSDAAHARGFAMVTSATSAENAVDRCGDAGLTPRSAGIRM